MMIRMTTLAILALTALAGGDVMAKEKEEAPVSIETAVITYRHGDVEFEGYLAAPKGLEGKRPGVLVVHAWMGLGGHERETAEALAELSSLAALFRDHPAYAAPDSILSAIKRVFVKP